MYNRTPKSRKHSKKRNNENKEVAVPKSPINKRSSLGLVLAGNNDWILACPKHYDFSLNSFIKETEQAAPNDSFPYSFYIPISSKLKEYFFNICEKECLSPFTKYLGFHVFQKTIHKMPKDTDVLLFAIVSLWIASKYYDEDTKKLKRSSIQYWTAYHYKNELLDKTEMMILQAINYNLYKRETLFEKMSLYLEIVKGILPKNDYNDNIYMNFGQICLNICDILHKSNTFELLKKYPIGLLTAAVLQAATVVATGYNIFNPLTYKVEMLSSFSVERIKKAAVKIHAILFEFKEDYKRKSQQ